MSEPLDELAEPLQRLEAACARYDAGNRAEAITIARALRAIFHPGPESTSLARRLAARHPRMLSTASKLPKGRRERHWPGLISWSLNPAASLFECAPKLDATRKEHRDVSLTYWWGEEPIYQSGSQKIRRRDLVLLAANQGGGDRVDPKLPGSYSWLVDGSGWKMTIYPERGPEREVLLHHGDLASLRQIGHEVLHSPELLALAEG